MLGFAPLAASPVPGAKLDWRAALVSVLANRATWPGFAVNVGVGGCFLAFAGLWAVPWLEHASG